MELTNVVAEIEKVQSIADNALVMIRSYDPAATSDAVVAQGIIDLTAQLLNAALTAWSAASGQEINQTTIAQLLPNQTPLSAPDSE